MKRMKWIIILTALILIPGTAFGSDQTCTTGSTTGSASGTLYTGAGVLRAIQITPDSGDVTLVIYDNTSAAGTVVATWTAKGSASPETVGRPYWDVVFTTGLYYTLSDTGAVFSVEYAQDNGKCD